MTTIELCFLVLIFLSGAILVYLAICGGLVRYLMRPKKRDNAFLIDYETREKKFDKAWLDLPAQTFTRPSPFGYDVFGRLYMADTPTDRFILCLHGHNNSSIGQLKYLSLFRDLGYNVFMPDHRRSGNSGGDSITFGCYVVTKSMTSSVGSTFCRSVTPTRPLPCSANRWERQPPRWLRQWTNASAS